jgi:NCAIR mutase (PurE)-related protein
MDKKQIADILASLTNGGQDIETTSEILATHMNFGDVKPDTSRRERLGFDEVIYGRSKSVEQLKDIAEKYVQHGMNFICTGLTDEKMDRLTEIFPDFEMNRRAGIMKKIILPVPVRKGFTAIVTAGTSDLFIAEEAAEILATAGYKSEIFPDLGVAGIHRFFSEKPCIDKADVVIVIAGMEGALASVAGGVFAQPVIAVPSSTGCGAALGGFTALFSMLSSCANGVTVVNIDNGFGAAMAAIRILNLIN